MCVTVPTFLHALYTWQFSPMSDTTLWCAFGFSHTEYPTLWSHKCTVHTSAITRLTVQCIWVSYLLTEPLHDSMMKLVKVATYNHQADCSLYVGVIYLWMNCDP